MYPEQQTPNQQLPVQPAPVQPTSSKKIPKGVIIAISVGASVLLLGIVAIVLLAVLGNNSQPEQKTEQSSLQQTQTSTSQGSVSTRDTERKTDIDALYRQVEAYFAINGGYPSFSDLNSSTWRTLNNVSVGADDKELADPLSASDKTLASTLPNTTTGKYTYQPIPSGCQSSTDSTGKTIMSVANPCTGFTLTALLENSSDYSKDRSSTSTQTFYIKKSTD